MYTPSYISRDSSRTPDSSIIRGTCNLEQYPIVKLRIDGLAQDFEGRPLELDIPRIIPDTYTIDGPYTKETVGDEFKGDGTDAFTLQVTMKSGSPLVEPGESPTCVYEVNEGAILTPDGKIVALLPSPLVAKIALEGKGHQVYYEAGMYDYMESLQGRVIPRCYGYFRQQVNLQELRILPWETKPTSKKTWNIFRLPHTCASLNILLLERLGEPVDLTAPVPPNFREHMTKMIRELADIEVLHKDLFARNILWARPGGFSSEAPSPSGTAQDGPSSTTDYHWRIIDWYDAEFSDRGASVLRGGMMNSLDTMIEYDFVTQPVEPRFLGWNPENRPPLVYDDDDDEDNLADDGGDDKGDNDDVEESGEGEARVA
ncbi:hypothetical protein GY45DRAFT_1364614 [Cubamyces sp. BRFM 1775]|nr:hypothetical protein GY45DRAFT_1364614 [Cubamyces sp. BRFM 1775]